MDLWEIYKASKGVPHSGDLYDALMGKSLGGGSVWETENAPYLFRRSGGSLRTRLLGKAKDKLVGASVGWNQLVQNGNFADTSNWDSSYGTLSVANNVGSFTVAEATTSARIDMNFTAIAGHKYLSFADIKVPYGTTPQGFTTFRTTPATAIAIGTLTVNGWTRISGIRNADASDASSGKFRVYFNASSGTVGDIVQLRNIQLIDLTLALGSTIADYAYTLESQQSGKGVKWLRDYGFFDKPYFAYDSGSLQSVNATKKITVGKNALNHTEMVVGGIDDITGTDGTNSARVNSGYIEVIQGETYTASIESGKKVVCYHLYDNQKHGIGKNVLSATATIPDGVSYIRFAFGYTNNDTITVDDVSSAQVELGSTATAYEPYTAHEYSLADLELRGVFKMDASHNIYAEGDTYESSGKVTRNTILRAYQSGDESLADAITDGTNTIVLSPNASTEQATPFTSPQIVDKYGTEQYIDGKVASGTRDVAVPVGHETEYKCSPIT